MSAGAYRRTILLDFNYNRVTEGVQQVNRSMALLDSGYRRTSEAMRNSGDEAERLRVKQVYLTEKIALQAEKVQTLRDRYDEAKQRFGENSRQAAEAAIAYNNAETSLDRFRNQLTETNEELDRMSGSAGNSSNKFQQVGNQISQTGEKITAVGQNIDAKLSKPVREGLTAIAEKAISFEDSWTGVEKTVNGSTEDLASLKEGFLNLSLEIPATNEEIASVGEIAGQLGIKLGEGGENLLKYTKTVLALGESTNLSLEEGATGIANYANIAQMSQDDVDKFGSTIVALGNNTATTESDILAMSLRIAGAGSQLGLTDAEILGFSATLSSVGIKAEMGGSAFSKAMINIDLAAKSMGEKTTRTLDATGLSLRELELLSANNSKAFKDLAQDLGLTATELNQMVKSRSQLEDFAKITGMTSSEFAKLVESSPAEAISEFLSGLANMDKQGSSTIEMIQELGFNEVRLRDTLLRMSNAQELANTNMELANREWENNTALTIEAEKRYATFSSRLQILKNTLDVVFIKLGGPILEILKNLIDMATPLIKFIVGIADAFSKIPAPLQKFIMLVIMLVAAIGPVLTMIGGIVTNVGDVITIFGQVGSAASGFAGFIGGLSSPITKVVAVILTLAAALAVILFLWAAITGKSADLTQMTSSIGKVTSAVTAPKRNATGTNFFSGGLTWVGEEGPELLELPTGSRIYNNKNSMDMANNNGSGSTEINNTQHITVNVDISQLDTFQKMESFFAGLRMATRKG